MVLLISLVLNYKLARFKCPDPKPYTVLHEYKLKSMVYAESDSILENHADDGIYGANWPANMSDTALIHIGQTIKLIVE
jgi:hypothetical protein